MDVMDAIRNRRSIRHYKKDPIDDETVQAVLDAANWAPSWGNTQCWRFIIVRDAQTRAAVADSLFKVMVDNELVANAATSAIKQAPVLVVVCAEKGKAGYGPDDVPVTDKGDWYMFDIALAMENMVLAAHAMGLGTVIVGGFDARKIAELLEVPDKMHVVTMTPLGIPEHKGQISPRIGLTGVIYNEKYGRK